MSAIKSTGNASTELRLATLLRRNGLSGWRRHRDVFGRPDFVWPQLRAAVFVDGCFWHGCPRCYQAPRGNAEYWSAKIARNRRRDRAVSRALRKAGWKVIRVWECRVEAHESVSRIARALE